MSRREGSDVTLRRLRALILSGELPPGAIVSQLTLARQLGVSTTPVREAMRQLQAEGLLETKANRRPRVSPLDVEDLQCVYAARILLEGLAVSLTVATMSAAHLKAIESDLAEMRRLSGGTDFGPWEVAHRRFHRRLIAGITPQLDRAISSYLDRSERYRHLGRPRGMAEADRGHGRIVDACMAGDGRAAAEALALHLARTAAALSATFAPGADDSPVRCAVELVTHGEALAGAPAVGALLAS